MKKIRIISQILLLISAFFTNDIIAQTTRFQRIIGSSGDERSYSIVQTKDGGYILTGYTNGNGAGGDDAYIIKTDGLGKVTWHKTYGTSADEAAWKIKQTSDSGYVIVGTSSTKKGDGIIIKTDINGNLKWSKIIDEDSTHDIYNVIESRVDGSLYITGFVKTDSFGSDAFLGKLSSTGSVVWFKKFGSEGDEEGYALVEDIGGNIAVTGMVINDTITVGGKLGAMGDEDYFIAQFDKNGNKKWMKNFGTSAIDQAWDIKSYKGFYVTTGWVNSGPGTTDILVSIIDTTGNLSNSFSYNAGGSSKGFSVIINPDETYSVTGYVQTTGKGREVFYLNTAKNGFINQFYSMGGNSTDGHWPSEILRTADGGFTIFSVSNSFRTGNSYDLYLIRLDNKGVSQCNQSTISGINFNANIQSSGKFGNIRHGLSMNNGNFTTKTVSGTYDSVLCCRLQAQVAGPTLRICKGEGIRIGKPSIPGIVYKWTEVGGTFSSSESSPLVYPTKTNTTYKLVVSSSDGKCLKDSANITVTIRPGIMSSDFVNDTFFCHNDSVLVTARSGAIDYSWKGKTGTWKGQQIKIGAEDKIILTITDTTTCLYYDTFNVTKKYLPVFELGKDTTICDNAKLELKGPANMKSYIWNGGEAYTRSIYATDEKTYTLLAIDSFGCKWTDSKVIYNNPSSSFSLGPDTSICEGINYTINGPTFLMNYYWNGVSTFNPNKTVNTPGTYICQAQNSFGCIWIDTIVLKKKPDPNFSLGADGGVCENGGRLLKGPSGVVSYKWDDGSTDSTYQVYFAGTYWLQVTGKNGCIFRDTINLVKVSNPKPELGKDTTICEKDSIYIDAGVFNSYKWSTGETTRIIKVKKAGLYEVIVSDINQCEGSDDKSVKTKFCIDDVRKIVLNDAIRVFPNPARNVLNIEVKENLPNGNYLIIYDIYSKKVFEKELPGGKNNITIDINSWSKGLYYLKLSSSPLGQSIKILVE
ncbi:MAG: T9SS type A sorting domain-containing protein [Bacteroidetes bacterium]|nr:T9SS type A sorting domain-containing protein [Bacteroidota bacterium]